MLIKVCGLKYAENIEKISNTEVNFLGFIFYEKSPRNFEISEELVEKINAISITKVGVFVDAPIDFIKSKYDSLGLDYVQLHGSESVSKSRVVQQFSKIIKVFKVETRDDFKATFNYDFADLFLFETKGKLAGGNGEKFNWEILSHYHGSTPFLLSGGIHLKDAPELKKIRHDKLIGVDVNSGFELDFGLKNIELVNEFKEKLNNRTHVQCR